jgi:hypothetical protein
MSSKIFVETTGAHQGDHTRMKLPAPRQDGAGTARGFPVMIYHLLYCAPSCLPVGRDPAQGGACGARSGQQASTLSLKTLHTTSCTEMLNNIMHTILDMFLKETSRFSYVTFLQGSQERSVFANGIFHSLFDEILRSIS